MVGRATHARERDVLMSSREKLSPGGAAGDAGALAKALEHADLRVVDIGARGAPPPELRQFGPYSHLFAFEPDTEEAGRLAKDHSLISEWRSVTVVPKAVSSIEGQAMLFMTVRPWGCSLLEPNVSAVSRFHFAKSFEVVARKMIPTISLDAAAQEYGFEDACFIKIDTQGTELDVLRSGERLVDGSVVAVHIESNFHPFYKGASLFADNDPYLRAKGFFLADATIYSERGWAFDPDIASRGIAGWADCLYLREPHLLLARSVAEAGRLLLRYVLVALAYKQYDLALRAVEEEPTAAVLAAVAGSAFAQEVRDILREDAHWQHATAASAVEPPRLREHSTMSEVD